jgi:hypothetical protein
LPRNAKLKFTRVLSEQTGKGVKVNLKGFVCNKDYNDGQDLGCEIIKKDMMTRLAIDKDKTLYSIEITIQEKPLGKLFLKVE